jgi:hypothetical protein
LQAGKKINDKKVEKVLNNTDTGGKQIKSYIQKVMEE